MRRDNIRSGSRRNCFFPTFTLSVCAPIILHPLVRGIAACNETLDAVLSRAERRLEGRLRDVAFAPVGRRSLPPMLWQHHELAHDLRQLAIALFVEGELDLALADLFGLDDIAVIERVSRAVRLEHLEGIDHVLDGHRLAVVPARFGPQAESHRRIILRIGECLREKAVGCAGLVEGGGRQGFVDQADPLLGCALSRRLPRC